MATSHWRVEDFVGFFPPAKAPTKSPPPVDGDGGGRQKSQGDGSYDSTITDFPAESIAYDMDMMVEVGRCPVESALNESAQAWARLRESLDMGGGADGPREEAARRLITNHEAVLRDITNPSPVSQMQLQRVDREAAVYVDQVLRETARRLLLSKRRPALQADAVHLDPSLEDQAASWSQTCNFLCWRIQGSDLERPGRRPDMSPGAAAAMRATLQELWMMTVSYTHLTLPTICSV